MKPLKLVIVGGVAGGATAAARARRLPHSDSKRFQLSFSERRIWTLPACDEK